MQDYHEFIQEILVSEIDLQQRIAELGEQITRDYLGEDLHLICILRGGVLFLADLMRHITVPHTIDFMAVSSYGSGTRQASGHVRITLDLKEIIQDRNVVLVEDIVDSGYTIDSIMKLLEIRNPKSLRVCTLLNKVERREVQVPIDYCGFIIPDKFVFGYGLDMDEYYRNLPFVATVDPARYRPDI